METVLEAFDAAGEGDGVGNTALIFYTIKGYGLPLQGHRDNHGLFLNTTQAPFTPTAL